LLGLREMLCPAPGQIAGTLTELLNHLGQRIEVQLTRAAVDDHLSTFGGAQHLAARGHDKGDVASARQDRGNANWGFQLLQVGVTSPSGVSSTVSRD
jgi:hypothetical protein